MLKLITGLNVVCSAAYSYQWGWFGGSGRVSAGGRQQSVEIDVVLGDTIEPPRFMRQTLTLVISHSAVE